MKGCAGGEKGEDCCRWSHVGKKLSGVGLSESAAPSRDAQYHETVRVDVEVVRLIGESVGVQSSDVTLLVRLNTRCHLLAFAATVEKQLQATVSIQ